MMGARLIRKVIEQWSDLTDRQHRVLSTMAFTAKDDDPRPAFFKGRDYLVSTLGLTPGTPASYESVRKTVAALVSRGAIKRAMHGFNGRNSVYELTLDRLAGEVKPLSHGAPIDPHSERGRGTLKEVKGHPDSAPKEIEEPQDLSLGGKSPNKVTSPSARVTAARTPKIRREHLRAVLDAERGA